MARWRYTGARGNKKRDSSIRRVIKAGGCVQTPSEPSYIKKTVEVRSQVEYDKERDPRVHRKPAEPKIYAFKTARAAIAAWEADADILAH